MAQEFNVNSIMWNGSGTSIYGTVQVNTFAPNHIAKWVKEIRNVYPSCKGIQFACERSDNLYIHAEIAGVRACDEIVEMAERISDFPDFHSFRYILSITFKEN